jgi:hypothetical protein
MNDNLKFRGKSLENNQWVFGFYANIQDKENYILQPFALGLFHCLVNPETVSQYTGVIDVEGNEIYGRDILEVLSIDSEEDKEVLKTLEIYFDEELCSFEFRNDWEPFNRQYGNDFRILGNIFDSHELINEGI